MEGVAVVAGAVGSTAVTSVEDGDGGGGVADGDDEDADPIGPFFACLRCWLRVSPPRPAGPEPITAEGDDEEDVDEVARGSTFGEAAAGPTELAAASVAAAEVGDASRGVSVSTAILLDEAFTENDEGDRDEDAASDKAGDSKVVDEVENGDDNAENNADDDIGLFAATALACKEANDEAAAEAMDDDDGDVIADVNVGSVCSGAPPNECCIETDASGAGGSDPSMVASSEDAGTTAADNDEEVIGGLIGCPCCWMLLLSTSPVDACRLGRFSRNRLIPAAASAASAPPNAPVVGVPGPTAAADEGGGNGDDEEEKEEDAFNAAAEADLFWPLACLRGSLAPAVKATVAVAEAPAGPVPGDEGDGTGAIDAGAGTWKVKVGVDVNADEIVLESAVVLSWSGTHTRVAALGGVAPAVDDDVVTSADAGADAATAD